VLNSYITYPYKYYDRKLKKNQKTGVKTNNV